MRLGGDVRRHADHKGGDDAVPPSLRVAHAVWTGILPGAIRDDRRVSLQVAPRAVGVFLAVLLLHAVWNDGVCGGGQTCAAAGPVLSGLGSVALTGRIAASGGEREA